MSDHHPSSSRRVLATDPVVIEAERALLAALLRESTPREAADRMCAALSSVPGATFTLLQGHVPRGDAPSDSAVHLLIGDGTDETARTLVVERADVYEAQALERVKRLFERLLEIAYPVRGHARAIHQLNNGLAALVANLELMELLVVESDSRPLDEPRRRELAKAFEYALASCTRLRTAVSMLSGVSGAPSEPAQPASKGPGGAQDPLS